MCCLAKQCESLIVFTGLTVDVLQGQYGDKRNVTCAAGFEALGVSMYTACCQGNGTWSNVINCTGKMIQVKEIFALKHRFVKKKE